MKLKKKNQSRKLLKTKQITIKRTKIKFDKKKNYIKQNDQGWNRK
jgi:hypothetical protein